MPALDIAEIEIQDVRVAVVFLPSELAPESLDQQQSIRSRIRDRAAHAGIAGEIVVMWRNSSGRKEFLCDPVQRPFFEAVRYDQLHAQRNRTLNWEL